MNQSQEGPEHRTSFKLSNRQLTSGVVLSISLLILTGAVIYKIGRIDPAEAWHEYWNSESRKKEMIRKIGPDIEKVFKKFDVYQLDSTNKLQRIDNLADAEQGGDFQAEIPLGALLVKSQSGEADKKLLLDFIDSKLVHWIAEKHDVPSGSIEIEEQYFNSNLNLIVRYSIAEE